MSPELEMLSSARELSAFCRGMAEYYEGELAKLSKSDEFYIGLARNNFLWALRWRAREYRFLRYFALPSVS